MKNVYVFLSGIYKSFSGVKGKNKPVFVFPLPASRLPGKYFTVRCAAILLVGLLTVTTVNAQPKIDVLHYTYAILLNDENDTLKGVATVQLRYLQDCPELSLDLTGINATGKGMKTSLVTGSIVRGHAQQGDQLRIFLLKPGKAGDTASFVISYAGIPADGLIISKNKFGQRTFFSDNWPNRAHHWIPCADDPADKASVEFIVTAPAHYQVVSNGIQTEETNLPGNKKLTHWKEEMPIPTKVMVIGVAAFAVGDAGRVNGCIPVTSWVFPENKTEGFYDYAQAREILEYLSDYIGPYPYRKLANVQSKTIFGGMENASAIFYFENSVNGLRQQESLLCHEIVHQWFGNTATEKSFAHLWLSEGFATYLTHVYLESRYGTDSLNTRMRKDRGDVIGFVNTSHRPVVDNTTDYMQLLNENSYQKGGWILHMLRRELGDSVFRKSVRAYYEAYTGKNADTRDLQKIFENISGKDLSVFFDQWLYRGVNPRLKIGWKYDAVKHSISVTVEQLQNDPFRFPLEIAFGNTTTEKLLISKKTETFNFPVKEKPVQVLADPNTSLLFEGTVEELH